MASRQLLSLGNREKYKKICNLVLFPRKNIKKIYFSILSKVPPPRINIELSEESSKDIRFILYIFHVLFNTNFRTSTYSSILIFVHFIRLQNKSVKQLVSKGKCQGHEQEEGVVFSPISETHMTAIHLQMTLQLTICMRSW